jgi:acyl carrier protein
MNITIENIKAIFRKEVDARVEVEGMDPDKSISDQGVDSLDQSSVFLALEDEFGIKIEDEDIEKLNTLNKILEFIKHESNAQF